MQKPATRVILKWAINILFSLATLVWAIIALDWQQVASALNQADYIWVLSGIAFILLTFVVRVFRWNVLFWPESFPPATLFPPLLIGQVVNYITPARAGDLVRAYLLGQATGISKIQVLTTVALEKFWDILMLILCIFIVGWFFPLPDWLLLPARSLIITTIIILVLLTIFLSQRRQASAWFSRFTQRWLPTFHIRLMGLSQNVLAGMNGLQHPQPLLYSVWWSLLTWGLGALTNYAIFRAFDLPLTAIPALVLLLVLQVGVAVPSLPGRIGVFEGLCVAVLALFNIPFDTAFSYGLVLHSVVFLPPILLAALLGLWLGLSPRQVFNQLSTSNS